MTNIRNYVRKIGDFVGDARLNVPLLVSAVESDEPEVTLILFDGKEIVVPVDGKIRFIDCALVSGVKSTGKATLFRPIELKSMLYVHEDDNTPCYETGGGHGMPGGCNRPHRLVTDPDEIFELTPEDRT